MYHTAVNVEEGRPYTALVQHAEHAKGVPSVRVAAEREADDGSASAAMAMGRNERPDEHAGSTYPITNNQQPITSNQ